MKNYFSHDYNARSDRKLVSLTMKYKMEGIGIYWSIVEMLYEEEGYISTVEYERIAFELRTSYDIVLSVIQDFDLFKVVDGKFYSESVNKRILMMKEKSEKAKASVKARWNKPPDTNVLRNEYERNTNKVKKRKEKESKLNDDCPAEQSMPSKEKIFYDVFDAHCKKREIENLITQDRYLEMKEEYEHKLIWWQQVQKCTDWLYDNKKKKITSQRLRNWMDNALKFNKETEIKIRQGFQDKKNLVVPQKVIKASNIPLWTPPL